MRQFQKNTGIYTRWTMMQKMYPLMSDIINERYYIYYLLYV